MLFWILSTIMNSLSVVSWKKTMDMATVSKPAFSLLWNLFWIILVIIFYYLWLLEKEAFLNIETIGLMIFCMIIWALSGFMMLDIYKNDKISTIMPYENLDKLFIMIIWFFVFSDTSINSLLFAIWTVIVITVFSVDFKDIKLPRNFWKLFISKWLKAVVTLILGYLLLRHNSMSITAIDALICIVMYSSMLKIVDFRKFKTLWKKYYSLRLWWSALWWISYFIVLFLISNLWVVITTLIWFFWLGTTLLFSYLFLWDKPEKKSIVLAILVFVLISLWYYFK